MRHQLVIQFRPTVALNFEKLVAIEDALIDELGDSASVDGHDVGSEEFNIFILTDSPSGTFQRAQKLLREMKPEGTIIFAYRAVGEEDYVILWPPSSTKFNIA
jgi:hypothetical protein